MTVRFQYFKSSLILKGLISKKKKKLIMLFSLRISFFDIGENSNSNFNGVFHVCVYVRFFGGKVVGGVKRGKKDCSL